MFSFRSSNSILYITHTSQLHIKVFRYSYTPTNPFKFHTQVIIPNFQSALRFFLHSQRPSKQRKILHPSNLAKSAFTKIAKASNGPIHVYTIENTPNSRLCITDSNTRSHAAVVKHRSKMENVENSTVVEIRMAWQTLGHKKNQQMPRAHRENIVSWFYYTSGKRLAGLPVYYDPFPARELVRA